MSPVTVSVSGVGSSALIPLDNYISPFNVGLGVTVTGTITYTVEHTFDNVFDPNYTPAAGNWFVNPDITGQSANADGNYAFPVTAIRLITTAGTGTATMTAIQAGVAGR